MNDRRCVWWLALALASSLIASSAHAGQDPHERFAPPSAAQNEQASAIDRADDANAPDPEPQRRERVRIGVLGGVGFPRPLAIEGLIKLERVVAFGVEYGALPTIVISGVSASLWSLAADARVFPFRDAFFIGLRAGYQRLGASTIVTVDEVGSANVAATVGTSFLNPRMGFLWTWESGISLGLDAGLQFPLHSHVTTDLPAIARGSEVESRLLTVANDIGQSTLPTVDLLRIGLLL